MASPNLSVASSSSSSLNLASDLLSVPVTPGVTSCNLPSPASFSRACELPITGPICNDLCVASSSPARCQPSALQLVNDHGSTICAAERKDSSCQQADGSRSAEIMEPELTLPEDILYEIHALMPMQDAARAACLSHAFLHSWRCNPKLIFDMRAFCRSEDVCKKNEPRKIAFSRASHAKRNKEDQIRDFVNRVDHIIRNHSGVGVKMFKLQTRNDFSVHPSYLDRWLQVAITPGIKEFVLGLPVENKMDYNFPASLLSYERANSIQSLWLTGCAFHSVDKVGCLSSLTAICLRYVGITGEELCLFLSNSFALERLDLAFCGDIGCLKIPFLLSKLNFLNVRYCKVLEAIECSAPNLANFNYMGPPIHISLVQVKKIQMMSDSAPNMLYYASTKLPSVAPNVHTLFLHSLHETVNTQVLVGKFLHLKYLEIMLFRPTLSPDYDFHSLLSFLDASPALKTFILRVEVPTSGHDPVDYSLTRCFRHDKLRRVTITGFCSSKTMIELTRRILENAISLKYLTLDTTYGYDKRLGKCFPLDREALMEARKALLAIKTHILGNVPPKINFKVIGPCNCSVILPSYFVSNHPMFSDGMFD